METEITSFDNQKIILTEQEIITLENTANYLASVDVFNASLDVLAKTPLGRKAIETDFTEHDFETVNDYIISCVFTNKLIKNYLNHMSNI